MSPEDAALRERIRRYVEARAPHQLPNVDTFLPEFQNARNQGKLEHLFADWVSLHGPEPPDPTAPPGGQQAPSPGGYPNSPYSTPPVGQQTPSPGGYPYQTSPGGMPSAGGQQMPPGQPASPGSPGTAQEAALKERFRRYYQRYAPEKMGNLDNTFESWKLDPEAFFSQMVPIHGPEPPDPSAPSLTSSVAPKAAPGRSGYSSKGPQWLWEMDDGSYRPYSDEEAAKLHATFLADPRNEKCIVNMRGIDYVFNFQEMTQTNPTTGGARRIRPPVGAASQAMPPTPPPPSPPPAAAAAAAAEEAPESFCCPLSMEVMKDPVMTPAGVTYERADIEAWVKEKGEDPQTREPVTLKDLRPNRVLKDLIDEWLAKHQV